MMAGDKETRPLESRPGPALIARSIAGLLFLLLVMAIGLFASAGTLSFWQAWVYLAVFGGSSLLVTIYLILYDARLLASRVKAGPAAETQKSQKVIQSLASLLFVALFIVPGLDKRFHWSAVPAVVSYIAQGLVALGFFIVFLVFRENSFTSAVIEVAKEQSVIDTGPYGVVRHPMYAGAAVLLIASPPALGSYAALPLPFLLMSVIVLRLKEEEKFLSTQLQGYEAYRRKVRYRLVPFVW